MKTKILFFLIALYCHMVSAQIQKAEVYSTGTKITYYPNECGNDIPEAENKLTFCDANNTLGVIEKSYGLNDHSIKNIVPNYFNDDVVFV